MIGIVVFAVTKPVLAQDVAAPAAVAEPVPDNAPRHPRPPEAYNPQEHMTREQGLEAFKKERQLVHKEHRDGAITPESLKAYKAEREKYRKENPEAQKERGKDLEKFKASRKKLDANQQP